MTSPTLALTEVLDIDPFRPILTFSPFTKNVYELHPPAGHPRRRMIVAPEHTRERFTSAIDDGALDWQIYDGAASRAAREQILAHERAMETFRTFVRAAVLLASCLLIAVVVYSIGHL